MKRRIKVREFEAAKQKLAAAAQVLEITNRALKEHVELITEITDEIQAEVETAKRINVIAERFIDRVIIRETHNGDDTDATPTKKELLEFETLIDKRFETFAHIQALHNELYYTQTHTIVHKILDEIGRDPELRKWLDAREKLKSKVTEPSRAVYT